MPGLTPGARNLLTAYAATDVPFTIAAVLLGLYHILLDAANLSRSLSILLYPLGEAVEDYAVPQSKVI